VDHDPLMLTALLSGSLLAGFVTGFTGFGTGLVASGLWFHALPAAMVPPLVAISSVAAQCAGLATIRPKFSWTAARPYLVGGILGVPLGVAALTSLSPDALRLSIGVFLLAYSLARLLQDRPWSLAGRAGAGADGAIGAIGGFLGGFAGLSGPVPIIWLQGKGLSFERQRAIFQPYNMAILSFATAAMGWGGAITRDLLPVAAMALPVTLLGAWIGGRLYRRASEKLVIRVVLGLLMLSGVVLIAQSLA